MLTLVTMQRAHRVGELFTPANIAHLVPDEILRRAVAPPPSVPAPID